MTEKTRVVDPYPYPDPDWKRIESGQEGKNDAQNNPYWIWIGI
jgi:hypothetical protein